jgi:AcrR family transcriptional regulator
VTSRGDATRERLLDVAEQLYGARGVEGVSLREIRLTAGQRNSSVLQYHFGDRDGLLLALTERHMPRVAALQQGLYDEAVAAGRKDDVPSLVAVLVRPYAEYLRRGASERAWVKIAAERSAHPETGLRDVIDHAPAAALEVGTAIYDRLVASVPPVVAADRIQAVAQACLHLCADRARFMDSSPSDVRRSALPFDTWIVNLVDMAAGAVLAPVTPEVRGTH